MGTGRAEVTAFCCPHLRLSHYFLCVAAGPSGATRRGATAASSDRRSWAGRQAPFFCSENAARNTQVLLRLARFPLGWILSGCVTTSVLGTWALHVARSWERVGRFLLPPTSTSSAPASATPPALRPVTRRPCACRGQRMRPVLFSLALYNSEWEQFFFLASSCSSTGVLLFSHISQAFHKAQAAPASLPQTPPVSVRRSLLPGCRPVSAGRCPSAASGPFPWQQPCSFDTALTLGLCHPGTPPRQPSALGEPRAGRFLGLGWENVRLRRECRTQTGAETGREHVLAASGAL